MKPLTISFFVLINFNFVVYAKDITTINFIKSFIQNEYKPTNLIYRRLCWHKNEILKLTKELANISNTRTASDFKENSHFQDHTILFLVDLDCVQSDEVFNNSALLRLPYRWLVIYDHQNQNQSKIQQQSKIRQILDLPLFADSHFVLAEKNEDNYTLSELHKPSTLGPTYSNPRGQYTGKSCKLIDTRPHRELFRRRQDVMGHPLTMSNVIQDSNSSLYHLPREDRLEIQYDYIPKISWMHARIAFEMLNATPRYIFSYRFGYTRNGTWSGMINDIITGRADLGTNCVANTERLSVVAFADCIAKFNVKFIFRQPPLSYASNIFTLPFSIDVWIAIIFLIIISSITMCIANKWEAPRSGRDQIQLNGSFGDAIFFSISALSQQGYSKVPKKLSGRITLLVVFTALMALYAAYSANIVVLLQAPSNAIRTLEQLAYSKMTLAAMDADYNRFVLKAPKDPTRSLISKKVAPVKGKAQYYKLNEGVELIRQGHFALHAAAESVYHRVEETYLESEKCDLTEVDFINALDPSVPVNKHSPYLELLRVTFKRIRESGIQSAQHRRMQVPKPRCSDRLSAFSSVGLVQLEPVLLFMVYGIGAAVLILFAEILVHKLYNPIGTLF